MSRASLENIAEGSSPIKRYEQEPEANGPFSLGLKSRRQQTNELIGNESNFGDDENSDFLQASLTHIDEAAMSGLHDHNETSISLPPVGLILHSPRNNGTYGIDHAFPEAPTLEEQFLSPASTSTFQHSTNSDSEHSLLPLNNEQNPEMEGEEENEYDDEEEQEEIEANGEEMDIGGEPGAGDGDMHR